MIFGRYCTIEELVKVSAGPTPALAVCHRPKIEIPSCPVNINTVYCTILEKHECHVQFVDSKSRSIGIDGRSLLHKVVANLG